MRKLFLSQGSARASEKLGGASPSKPTSKAVKPKSPAAGAPTGHASGSDEPGRDLADHGSRPGEALLRAARASLPSSQPSPAKLRWQKGVALLREHRQLTPGIKVQPRYYHELRVAIGVAQGTLSRLAHPRSVALARDDERQKYSVSVRPDGTLWQQHAPLKGDTIFVLDAERTLYAGRSEVGRLHHTTYAQGRPVLAAGELTCDDNGRLLGITNSSGHYLPPEASLGVFLRYLQEKGVKIETIGRITAEQRSKPYSRRQLAKLLAGSPDRPGGTKGVLSELAHVLGRTITRIL